MPVTIKANSGGGSVTLDAGTTSTDTTLTLPNTTGTILQSGTAVTVAQGGTGAATLTANGALIGNGTSAVTAVSPTTTGNVLFTTDGSTWSATQKIVAGTSVASTSGTSIDFTSIPSWVKRVTVMFSGVSTNGSSNWQIQLGSGSITTSGYLGIGDTQSGSNNGNISAGFVICAFGTIDATAVVHGRAEFVLLGSNIWCCVSQFGRSSQTGTGSSYYCSGSLTLSGALDRVRITTAGGTDTFDAGSINILYE